MRLNSSTVSIRFWDLLGSQHRAEAHCVHCNDAREKPKLAELLGLISWVLTPFAFCKGYSYVTFGWFRLAGNLSKCKHKDVFAPSAS